MRKIAINEFLPPITYRLARYVKKQFFKYKNISVIRHPFDAIPKDIKVSWILDVGANMGDVAIAALESYPNSQIICFEPVKSTFEELRKNLEPFPDRAHFYNCALSDSNEEAEINITTAHGANSIEPQAGFHQACNPHVREVGKEKIRLVRLDDIAEKFPNQKFDIVKIDVEGHELNVLRGGKKFFSSNVDVIIIEISLMRDQSWNGQAVFDIFAFLKDAGFILANITDLYYVEDKAVQLTQMDCVFRHKSMLKYPTA
jgi:FkbM family methyltransferase